LHAILISPFEYEARDVAVRFGVSLVRARRRFDLMPTVRPPRPPDRVPRGVVSQSVDPAHVSFAKGGP